MIFFNLFEFWSHPVFEMSGGVIGAMTLFVANIKGQVSGMWKKLWMVIFALASVSSAVFAYDQIRNALQAQGTNFANGGSITGRIGPAGTFPSGAAGSMGQGDLIAFSATTSKGTPLKWRLIANALNNHNRPGTVVDNPSALYGYDLSDGPQVSHGVHDWHAFSTLLDPTPYMNTATFKRTDTIIKSEIAQINNNVAANPIENGLIKDRLIMNTPADDNPNTTKQNYVDNLDRRIIEFNVL